MIHFFHFFFIFFFFFFFIFFHFFSHFFAGEYTPQIGFGWTNGVSLVLIQSLYPEPEEPEKPQGLVFSYMLIAAVVLGSFVAVAGGFMMFQSYQRQQRYLRYMKLGSKSSGGREHMKDIASSFIDDDSSSISTSSSSPVHNNLEAQQRREARADLVETVL